MALQKHLPLPSPHSAHMDIEHSFPESLKHSSCFETTWKIDLRWKPFNHHSDDLRACGKNEVAFFSTPTWEVFGSQTAFHLFAYVQNTVDYLNKKQYVCFTGCVLILSLHIAVIKKNKYYETHHLSVSVFLQMDECMNQKLYSAVGPSVADEFCSFVHKGCSRKRHYMGLKMTMIAESQLMHVYK